MSYGIADLNTGKIIGCRKNSYVWFHEKGHLIYNKSEKGITNSYHQQNYFSVMILFIIAGLFFHPLAFIALLLYIVYNCYSLYEELWCWKYAKINYSRCKDKEKIRR